MKRTLVSLLTVAISLAAALLVVACLGRVSSETGVDVGEDAAKDFVQHLQEGTQAIPSTPPDAAKISVSAPDAEGYATVSGAAGAVPGDASVAIVNLKARVLMTTTSDSNGAFAAPLFAPPGSEILIKYDLAGNRVQQLWVEAMIDENPDGVHDYMNPLPGTIIRVGPAPSGDDNSQSFHSVGAIMEHPRRGWTGWWLSGTLQTPPGDASSGLSVLAGQTMTLTAQLRASSPAINCTGTPTYTIWSNLDLRYMFGADGNAHPWGNWFDAFLFTPTGLPIEHTAGGESELVFSLRHYEGLTCLTNNAFEGFLQTTFTVPADFPDGIYQPIIAVEGNVPTSLYRPLALVWYDQGAIDELMPVRVGSPAEPRIPWVLLADYPVHGHRGVRAREDDGLYNLNTWTSYPPQSVIIPRLNDRTGQPVEYRLEPGSNWVSGTERRFPNSPVVHLALPSGQITVEVDLPDGGRDLLGPAPLKQSSIRTPTLLDGTALSHEGGQLGDVFHLTTLDDTFAYSFEQYGQHVIRVSGFVDDIYGNRYRLDSTFDVVVARVLDLDPAQLPSMPFVQGDAFASGLHLFPPVAADVRIDLHYLPYSDPAAMVSHVVTGKANRFGYFQPPPEQAFYFELPGEYRVDISAQHEGDDGVLWAGSMTWGSVVEGSNPLIEAHGRRGSNYPDDTIDDMPPWFIALNLPPKKLGIDTYYPYFSGDIHWGHFNDLMGGNSIMPAVTIRDLTAAGTITGTIYDVIKSHHARATNLFRPPPSDRSFDGLVKRLEIGEAPLFLTTQSGIDAAVAPEEIDLWGYWYASSQRPDLRVRELIMEDGAPTPYWRYEDTYGMQIGQAADGDQPGDLKWEFGGIVFRVISETNPITEYAAYGSLWVHLPFEDTIGTMIGTPFQDATGASINFGPILTYTLEGQPVEVDMLFLPKGIRPGDVLELGDIVSFSGHVGPPLDSRVAVTVTSPSGDVQAGEWQANKIGWLHDPTFDFPAEETGRWTVDVFVEHDQPYIGNGVTPQSHNTGTVMGTSGRYEFYVIAPDSPRLIILEPGAGVITWPGKQLQPITIRGVALPGTSGVRYTIHDKGVVMGQGNLTPGAAGNFTLVYNAAELKNDFPMVSLTAHDEVREGLSDEVTISFMAEGAEPLANKVTLIGEEVFVESTPRDRILLPAILRK